MAEYFRAKVTIPASSGIPANSAVNTFAFMAAGVVDRNLAASEIKTRLAGFYGGLTSYLNSWMTWSQASVQVYDYKESQPRIPFYDESLGLSAEPTTNNDLPPEVSLCLSFQGSRVSGVNMRRRRGRIYVGPLQVLAGDQAFPSQQACELLVSEAKENLLNYTPRLVDWAIYSLYTHHGVPVGQKYDPETYPEKPDLLAGSFTPVVDLWVDNAWDTQRRRGTIATTRYS